MCWRCCASLPALRTRIRSMRSCGNARQFGLPMGDLIFSRYADVAAILKDPRFAKHPLPRSPFKAARVLFRMFLLLNPPDHTRLRRVVAPAFSPSAVAALRPVAASIADGLLPSGPGTVELVGDFAYPLPLAVIGDLLGIPATDRSQVAGWSRTLTESLDAPFPARIREVGRTARAVLQGKSHPVAAARAATRIAGYAKQRIADAAKEPATEFEPEDGVAIAPPHFAIRVDDLASALPRFVRKGSRSTRVITGQASGTRHCCKTRRATSLSSTSRTRRRSTRLGRSALSPRCGPSGPH
jgi:cytochrome P450